MRLKTKKVRVRVRIKQLFGNEMPGTTPSITPRISMEGTFMMQGNGKKKGSGRPKSAQ